MRRPVSIDLHRWLPVFVVGAFVLLLSASAVWRYWRETSAVEVRARDLIAHRLVDEQHRLEQLLRSRDHSLVAEEVAQLGSVPEVTTLALVDGDGRVLASTRLEVVNRLLDVALPQFDRTRLQRVQQDRRLMIDRDADGDHLLAYQPIVLETAPGEIRPRSVGGLLLQYDLASGKAAARREAIVSTLTEIAFAFVIMALVMFMLRRWLSEPLEYLRTAVARISDGDFAMPVELTGRGELADLGAAVARLEEHLRVAAEERDRHLAELQQNERDLAITLHSIGDAVIATDAAGRIARMNPAAERLTGWPLESARGQPLPAVFRIINTLTRVLADDPVQAVRASNGVVELANHTTLIARDGQEFQIADSAAPIRNAAGAITGVVLVFSDVTEQYRIREALSSVTEMLENTGAIARVGGWELDIRSARLFWSRETCRIHEIDPPVTPPLEEAINFYAPEARPVIEAAVREAMEHGTPYDVELPLITARHRRIWVRAQCSPVIEDGKVVRLCGAFHDITDRKLAEQQRVQSHDLLTNLAQLVPSAIYQYRLYPDGRSAFPYANPGINTIYEVTPEEVRDDATPVFGRLHPDDLERVGTLIQESAKTLTTFYCEFRVILPRQGLRWRWSQAQPERTEDGGTLWYGIISDITERKQAEEAQAALQARLMQAQKMESVGLLAGGVAHDFNNMLGVIVGNTELALNQLDPALPVHQDLQEILKAALRSADLTRQLLAFARKQEVVPRVLDLNDQIADSLKMLQRLIGENVALEWQPGEGLWPISMDPTQVDQILTNLCVNAQGAIADVGTVSISTSNCVVSARDSEANVDAVPGEYVRLCVGDTGVGMTPETLSHIFEPFFTTKDIGKGTGLGLATVYGAIRQNRGFIRVASEPDHGTRFEIFLPRHIPSGSPGMRRRRARAADESGRGHETILLVEDEPAVLRLTARVLESYGYTVVSAGSPGEALQLAKAHGREIHLLLTDVVMPSMNGRDLANTLTALYPNVKRLFMSGHTADVIAQHGMLDPGVICIEKPFSPASLVAMVRDVLDHEYGEVDVSEAGSNPVD